MAQTGTPASQVLSCADDGGERKRDANPAAGVGSALIRKQKRQEALCKTSPRDTPQRCDPRPTEPILAADVHQGGSGRAGSTSWQMALAVLGRPRQHYQWPTISRSGLLVGATTANVSARGSAMPLAVPRTPLGDRLRIAKTRSHCSVLPENKMGKTNRNIATAAADPGARSPDSR